MGTPVLSGEYRLLSGGRNISVVSCTVYFLLEQCKPETFKKVVEQLLNDFASQ